MLVILGSQACGRKHAKTAANNPHFIRKDVAEHVLGNENIKLVWVAGHLHGSVVDVHMAEL